MTTGPIPVPACGYLSDAQREWAQRITMVLIDNEMRLRSHEQRIVDAEARLAELERRAGITPPQPEDGE